MSDIIVKFKPSGHKDLVAAIKAIQAAEKNLTVAGKKHNIVVADMTAKLKAQNLSWKKLGVSMKTAGQAAKGNRVAMAKLNLAMKENISSGNGMLKANRLIGSSFATMRSHLLLFQFAMAMGINQISKFAQEAAKVEAMERGFNTLAGGSANASVAIDKLGEATNGTLSNFDMFQQANNAMILGVTRNSDEMADLFGMAKKLGDALGRDVASSVESLVTGIGRQSRMMLDNLGIIVDTEKAYKDYASELKKNASALTDAEKKQAFMNATLVAARQKIKDLPEGVSDANESFQQLSAATANLNQAIGDAFLPIIIKVANAMTAIFKAFDSDRVQAYATVVGVTLTGAFLYYIATLKRAILWQTRLGWGALATAAGVLASEIVVMSGFFEDADEDSADLDESIKDLSETLQTVGTETVNQELQNFIDKMAETNQFLKFSSRIITNDLMKEFSEPLIKEEFVKTDALKQMNTQLIKLQKDAKKYDTLWLAALKDKGAEAASTKRYKEMGQLKAEQIAKLKKNIETETLSIQNALDSVNLETFLNRFEEVTAISGDLFEVGEAEAFQASLGTIIKSELELAAVLAVMQEKGFALDELAIQTIVNNVREKKSIEEKTEAQKQSNKEKEAAAKLLEKEIKLNESILRSSFNMGKSYEDAGKAAEAAAKQAVAAKIQQALIEYMAKAFAELPFPASLIVPALGAAMGSALNSVLSGSSSSSKSSSGSSVSRFAEGGYVGGRPHSQGGTIIEAERGEFVMSKNAVESIGLETLNQMNQSGAGGSINVSVTGNVLTQDFVEGELAESIKEAVRRGSDFGLS